MKILKIEFKNFTSYGNKIQKIEFSDKKADLFLVSGNNGSGKSSLAKIITYLCYGKVDGSNLKDLPNRINGNLWGKIWLESKENKIEIERGISPNIFNVRINGVEYDVSGKSNLQDFLETEIFEIPYHVFKNVIILSVNDFKSFITMSPFDKKLIIDKIFGFSIINRMKDIVKFKRKTISSDLKSLDDEIRSISESVSSVEAKIKNLEQLSNEETERKISDVKEMILKLNEERGKLNLALDTINTKMSTLESNKNSKIKNEANVNAEIKTNKEKLNLYNNNLCPTCSSSLTSEFHVNHKNEIVSSLSNLEEIKSSIKNEIEEIKNSINKINESKLKLEERNNNILSKINYNKQELIKISNSKNNTSDHFYELINEFNSKKELKESERIEVEYNNNFLSILEDIVGEEGIKRLALKSILPSLNSNVSSMASEMGIPHQIKFDEKFDCYIYHLGQEISPKTLSTGERKKIDFVIIISLIKMMKMRFPGLNVLFLDEIFSSIDESGVHHIINILHKTIQDIGLNTFVINHTVLPSEYFDKKLEVTKDSGFSEFKIEQII